MSLHPHPKRSSSDPGCASGPGWRGDRRRGARPIRVTVLAGAGPLLAGLAAVVPGPARAQLFNEVLSPEGSILAIQPGVASRIRQQPDSGSVRLGSVVIRPEVVTAFGYDTNPRGTRAASGSAIARNGGTVQAATDWSRHALNAAATVEDVRYLDEPRQSFTNWSVAGAGSYEIGRDVVRLSGAAQQFSEIALDLDVPQFDRALAYQVYTGRLSYRAAFNRLTVEPALEVFSYRYDNGAALGTQYVQSYRNRDVVAPSVTASYELSPGRSVVAALRGATASYTNRAPGAVERDFNDFSVLVGLDYEATNLWRYRLLVGYQRRDFSASQVKSIQAPVVEGEVIYTPTRLTRVSGALSRRIQDSADETDVGFTETALRLTVDHEYRRDIFLRGSTGLLVGEYGQTRGTQMLVTAGVGATVLVNRNVALSLTYDFASRQSDGTANLGVNRSFNFGSSYIQNQVLVQLGFTL